MPENKSKKTIEEKQEKAVDIKEVRSKKNEKELSDIPQDVIDSLPEEQREKFISIIREKSFMGVMRQSHPFLDKIEGSHITEIIKSADEGDKRDRIERKEERGYNIKILIVVIIAVIGIIIYLVEKQEKSILDTVIGALLGFGGGYGVGKFQKKKD